MRIIEKCWVDLNAGYKSVLSLESRLKSEWHRAVQVASKREYLSRKSRLKRSRNITGGIFLAFIFTCIFLWIAGSYSPDNGWRFLFYLCILTIPGFVSGIFFLFYLYKSLSQTIDSSHPSLELVDAWWNSLAPKRYIVKKAGDKGEIEFLKSLSFLNDEFIAMWGLFAAATIGSDTDVLLLGPNGIWIFEVKYWNGKISKSKGTWFQEKNYYLKGGIPTREEISHQDGPDEQWLHQKNEIIETIKAHLPSVADVSKIVRGGVVFTHQKMALGQIEHPVAAYGGTSAWHKRIRETKSIAGFTLEDRLRVLDVLVERANDHEREVVKIVSAAAKARSLYEASCNALREYVSMKVK